jgi:hypothetical protein
MKFCECAPDVCRIKLYYFFIVNAPANYLKISPFNHFLLMPTYIRENIRLRWPMRRVENTLAYFGRALGTKKCFWRQCRKKNCKKYAKQLSSES